MFGSISTLNKANVPVEAFGSRVSGALVKNGVSSTLKKGDVVAHESAFRKIVSVDERFVSEASIVRTEPGAADSVL